jgi:hypothetical protein
MAVTTYYLKMDVHDGDPDAAAFHTLMREPWTNKNYLERFPFCFQWERPVGPGIDARIRLSNDAWYASLQLLAELYEVPEEDRDSRHGRVYGPDRKTAQEALDDLSGLVAGVRSKRTTEAA